MTLLKIILTILVVGNIVIGILHLSTILFPSFYNMPFPISMYPIINIILIILIILGMLGGYIMTKIDDLD